LLPNYLVIIAVPVTATTRTLLMHSKSIFTPMMALAFIAWAEAVISLIASSLASASWFSIVNWALMAVSVAWPVTRPRYFISHELWMVEVVVIIMDITVPRFQRTHLDRVAQLLDLIESMGDNSLRGTIAVCINLMKRSKL
jgi:hypothetical protein